MWDRSLPKIYSLWFLTWKNSLAELIVFAEVVSVLHKGGCFIHKDVRMRGWAPKVLALKKEV